MLLVGHSYRLVSEVDVVLHHHLSTGHDLIGDFLCFRVPLLSLRLPRLKTSGGSGDGIMPPRRVTSIRSGKHATEYSSEN
jgi:hypothetical protein